MSEGRKLTESAEHDMYITQLKEVFDSCDQTGSGALDRQELLKLCDTLQLEDQSQYLVDQLLKDKLEVDFDEFRESFVNILCQTYTKEPLSDEEDSTERDSDDEREEEEDGELQQHESPIQREVSPKLVVREKRYGRRSMPVNAEDLEDLSMLDEDDIEVASSTKSLKHSITVEDDSDSEEDSTESHKKRRRRESAENMQHTNDGTETFEAEGQMNLMLSDIGSLSEEEDYLRGIWTNLGVGLNGYIDINELAKVCSHIGMEEMNDTQLQQLFDKLDADGDGRVSFREFLDELFQHTTPTGNNTSSTPKSKDPTPTRPLSGTTPTRALSAQKKIKFPGGEERTTPSVAQGIGVSGLFSALDPERTGFAKPEDIIDLWEKYNVPNGADVLLSLGFELNATVNLSELSSALEQELLNPEDHSAVYQAAVTSYQQEMRNIKAALEQAVWAKDKLKQDLAEANARNSILAKEVDERHASMEKSSQSKLLSIERKYQEQVKQLQTELDKERENFSVYTASHKHNMDTEIEELKNEEAKLREQLSQAQKELEKQGHDLEDVTGQLEESEKQGQRLQKELSSVEEMHRKLAEYESTGMLSLEEQKFTQEKLQRLEVENMELKDQNDELTAEIEQLKQQVTPSRKPGDPEPDSHTPIRKDGSIMSDYIKPVIVRKTVSSSAEYSDDESRAASSLSKQPLKVHHEDDDISVGSSVDQETISELRREIQELKDHFDIERREIEQAYKLEITSIEEEHDQEKAQLLAHIEKEKGKISDEFERLQQQALAELAKELQTNFAHEKEDLVQKQESEKNHLQQLHEQEKEHLTDRLKQEHKEQLDSQIQQVKSHLEQEKFQFEEALADTEPFIQTLEEKIAQLEHKLTRQKEQNEKELKRQKTEMEGMLTRHMQKLEDVQKQKYEAELKYKKEVSDLEIAHKKEIMELKSEIDRQGQDLREVQRQRAELELELKQQKNELELCFQQEKHEILELYEDKMQELETHLKDMEEEKDNIFSKGLESLHGKLREDFFALVDTVKQEGLDLERHRLAEEVENELKEEFETQKSELSHIFEKEKTELVEKYEEQIGLVKRELTRMEEKLEEEREALAQRFTGEKEAIEEQLAQQIREELEEEFCQQMEDIRDAYEGEKQEFEAQANLLKGEVEELQRALDDEDKNRRKIDELKKANSKLQQEKRQAEKGQAELREALESTKKALEARIDELLAEKEGAIAAVKTQFVESSKQSGKDRAAYDAMVMEKESLEKKVQMLTEEVHNLQAQASGAADLEREVERLKQDNVELCQHLQEKSTDGQTIKQPVPEHAQRAIQELTQEKSELEEQLVDLQTRYHEVEDMAKKYSHLQFDYGQMTIGQSVVEETLKETQEKLASTETRLMQCERELKEARRYMDKSKLYKKKYEDVCKERDKVSHLAKSLKEQLNKANSAQKEEHEDKGKLTAVLEEKKQLELQLQKISDKLLEATTNFSVSQSEHIRELQQWKEQCSNMVDLQKYTKLQIDLVDSQRSLRDLQEVLRHKEEHSSKCFQESSEKHQEEVKGLEDQKESLRRKLAALQHILDGQIDKFKQQYEASEKRNALVVDLYKENADLLETLARVEEQKKDAISRCYKLEDQCNILRRMIKRVAKAAIT